MELQMREHIAIRKVGKSQMFAPGLAGLEGLCCSAELGRWGVHLVPHSGVGRLVWDPVTHLLGTQCSGPHSQHHLPTCSLAFGPQEVGGLTARAEVCPGHGVDAQGSSGHT